MSSQQNSVYKVNPIVLTPTIIVPLLSFSHTSFKVRTLLDSGSEANWISKDILSYIKYKKLSKVRLKVRHFNGVFSSNFDLVQVYIENPLQAKPVRKSANDTSLVYDTLDCLAYDHFFHHRLVHGIKNFIKNTGKISDGVCDLVVEPSGEVSHSHINLGTGLVLSNTGKIKIMDERSQPIILRSCNLMLEPTVFGYAVSGDVPATLAKTVQELQVGYISPTVINDQIEETSCKFIGCQIMFKSEEIVTHTKDDLVKQKGKVGVNCDKVKTQYVIPLPFNRKLDFLQCNEYLARIRARNQHRKVKLGKSYTQYLSR